MNTHVWLTDKKTERQKELIRLVRDLGYLSKFDYINLVSAGKYGDYASIGPNYTYAVFGRDSIEVAEDLLHTHQHLAHTIIHTLAKLQGTKHDQISEEEPGKIHHEYRSRIFNGKPVPAESLNIMHTLQRFWGKPGSDELIYYGSADATPLFIKLIGTYVDTYGKHILEEKYQTKEGKDSTIYDSLILAGDWLIAKIESSPWKLLEFKRLNPNGIQNQTWKDSTTSYIHNDGTIADPDLGIASVELQAFAYDALHVLRTTTVDDVKRRKYHALAQHIQKSVLEHFWMPHEKFFAEGLDRDTNGKMRKIETLTSNAGILLNSRLLAHLLPSQRHLYIKGIVSTICGPEFLTEAGIRSRALRHKAIPGFADYHGSFTVWPKETFDIAKGLRNFNLHHLADQIENRIVRSMEIAGDFMEFFYVSEDGKVWYDGKAAATYFEAKSPGTRVSLPEPGQAWSISAMLSILSNHRNPNIAFGDNYEEAIWKAMPHYQMITDIKQVIEPESKHSSQRILTHSFA